MPVDINHSIEAMRVHRNIIRARSAGLPATLTLEEWLGIIEQFGGMCAYCEARKFQVLDHFIPLVASGGTVAENCLPVCSQCNSLKSGRVTLDMHVELPLDAKIERVRHMFSKKNVFLASKVDYFKVQERISKKNHCVYGFLKNGISGYAHFAVNSGKVELLVKQLEMYHCNGFVRLACDMTASEARNMKLYLQRSFRLKR